MFLFGGSVPRSEFGVRVRGDSREPNMNLNTNSEARTQKREPPVHRQSTSGASEMIFMKRRSRSSRATGPNTRVPIGSF